MKFAYILLRVEMTRDEIDLSSSTKTSENANLLAGRIANEVEADICKVMVKDEEYADA